MGLREYRSAKAPQNGRNGIPAAPTMAAMIPTIGATCEGGIPRFWRYTGVNAAIWPQKMVSKRLATVYKVSSQVHEARTDVRKLGAPPSSDRLHSESRIVISVAAAIEWPAGLKPKIDLPQLIDGPAFAFLIFIVPMLPAIAWGVHQLTSDLVD